MDFILSKFINRSPSPIPQNLEKNHPSDGTELVNKDNNNLDDTFQKLNNHSNEKHIRLDENVPIFMQNESGICRKEENDNLICILNEIPNESTINNQNNNNNKEMEVLNEATAVVNTNNNNNTSKNNNNNNNNNDNMRLQTESTKIQNTLSDLMKQNNKIGIMRLDSDIHKNDMYKIVTLDEADILEELNNDLAEINNTMGGKKSDKFNLQEINKNPYINKHNIEEMFNKEGVLNKTFIMTEDSIIQNTNNLEKNSSEENLENIQIDFTDNSDIIYPHNHEQTKIELNEFCQNEEIIKTPIDINLDNNSIKINENSIHITTIQNEIEENQLSNESKLLILKKPIDILNSDNDNRNELDLTSNNEKIRDKLNCTEEIQNITSALSNISLNDILMNENENKNLISAVSPPELCDNEQQICVSQNIPNLKEENVKQSNVSQQTTNYGNNKAGDATTTIIKQSQLKQEYNVLKNSEENINPYEIRRLDETSSLFSTPDSVSPNETFSETSLPDIINTLPTITISDSVNDNLNISTLTHHLNALQVNVTEESGCLNATITKSSGSPSNISSDDELFAECESFPVSANNSTNFNTTKHTESTESSSKLNEKDTESTEPSSNLNETVNLNEKDTESTEPSSNLNETVNLNEKDTESTEPSSNLNETVSLEEKDTEFTEPTSNLNETVNLNEKDTESTEPTSNLNETVNLNEKDDIENFKDIINDIPQKEFKLESMNDEIDNEVNHNSNVVNELKPPNIKITPVTPDNSIISLNVTDEKISSIEPSPEIEQQSVKEDLESKNDLTEIILENQSQSPQSPLEFFSINENLNDNSNDLVSPQNQMNVSAQWTDVIFSVNSNDNEDLENSHIDLLNTSPQELINSNSTQEDNVEEKLSEPLGNIIKIENSNESENVINKEEFEINENIIHQLNQNIPPEQNAINETMVLENKILTDPPNNLESETYFQTKLSNSRNSLNDIENLNINKNVSGKISPSYSLNLTMECNDELLNKTQDISIRNSISELNQTRDISPLNTTENIVNLNKTIDMVTSFNKTIDEENIEGFNLNKKCNLSIEPNEFNSLNEHNIDTANIDNQTFVNSSSYNVENQHQSNNLNNNTYIDNQQYLNNLSQLNNRHAKFADAQISEFNNEQLLNKNSNLTKCSNLNNENSTNDVITSNDDFEPMDVDPQDVSQQQFDELNNTFKKPEIPSFGEPLSCFGISGNADDQFKSIGSNDNNIDLVFQSCDFDYLSKRGNNSVRDIRKDSLLLRFDPLLGKPVPVVTNIQNHSIILEEEDIIPNKTSIEEKKEFKIDNNLLINVPTTITTTSIAVENKSKVKNKPLISPIKSTIDNYKDTVKSISSSSSSSSATSETVDSSLFKLQEFEKLERTLQLEETRVVNEKMSVDVIQNNINIENDVQSNENINSNINSNEKHDLKMEDLEKKIKNEVLKTEDVEKKLKDAEQREEALLKRITEKDKTIAKMGGVIEAYEKAIAELIAEKEQITQNYERQMEEIKSERDLNKHHLESLESTFTDLHAKYERSKQLLVKLKASEEELQAEMKKNLENLGLQEQRYEKMKNHAMQQLEIANNKLEHLSKNHQLEITKLKALLKKEEIAKSSINEQLIQKSKENEELVKICDELISSGSTS